MKKISKEHFERMNIICRKLESISKDDLLFLPEFKISQEINEMIKTIETPSLSDFEKIYTLIKNVDDTEHYNGSHWHDYKIHLNALLLENGFDSRIT